MAYGALLRELVTRRGLWRAVFRARLLHSEPHFWYLARVGLGTRIARPTGAGITVREIRGGNEL